MMQTNVVLKERRADVMRHVLAGGMRLTAYGVGVGLLGAIALARALSSLIGSAEQHYTMMSVTSEDSVVAVISSPWSSITHRWTERSETSSAA